MVRFEIIGSTMMKEFSRVGLGEEKTEAWVYIYSSLLCDRRFWGDDVDQ